jgi:hypothetical protein
MLYHGIHHADEHLKEHGETVFPQQKKKVSTPSLIGYSLKFRKHLDVDGLRTAF